MAPVVQEIVGGTGTSFTTSTSTLAGDYIVVLNSTISTVPTSPGGTFTTGWTLGPDQSSLATGKVRTWYRKLASGGSAVNVTITSGRLWVLVVRGAHDTTFLDDSDGTSGNGNSFRTVPSMDAVQAETLYLGFWLNNHQSGSTDSITPPSGMTELAEDSSTGTSSYVASQTVAAGATGTRTPTFTRAASGSNASACVGMLIRAGDPAVTDTAVGVDTTAVQRASDTTDTAAGSDTVSVVRVVPASDAATGSDATTLVGSAAVTDSAAGSDTLDLLPNNPPNAFVQEIVGGSGTSFTTSAGVAAGDYLVVFNAVISTVPAQPGGTFATGWTLGPDQSALTNGKARSWYRRVTSGGAVNVTVTSAGWLWVVVVRGAHDTAPLDDSTGTSGTTTATRTLPSLTSPRNDDLLLALWFNNHQSGSTDSITPAAGMTEIGEASSTGTSTELATEVVAAGATGTRTPTFTRAVSATNPSATLGMLIRPAAVPVSSTDTATGTDATGLARTSAATDTATGSDTAAVERASAITDTAAGGDLAAVQRGSTVTDTAAGADGLAVAVTDYKTVTDSAAGADAVVVEVPSVAASADSAAGSDSVLIAVVVGPTDAAAGADTTAVLRDSSLTDTAATDDATTLQRASDVTDSATAVDAVTALARDSTVTDAAAGVDAVAILRISALTDTAVGVDTTLPGPRVTDTATGVDHLALVVIPFTRVLPLVPERKYEVVVVARVMQAAGPPTFVQVDPLEWSSLSYRDVLGQAQGITVSTKPSTLTPAVRARFLDLARNPTELWVLRSGQIVAAGPVLGGQEKEKGVEVTAGGLLTYLEWMGIDADQRFAGTDQALVCRSLIDAWQSTASGDFGIDTSSVTPSGRTVDVTYLRDETPILAKILGDLGKADGGFDLEVDPASRRLIVWSPQRGVDRSGGEDAVILDSRNVTSTNLMFSSGPADISSDVFATASRPGGDAPLWSAVSSETLRAQFGRTVTTRSYSSVGDQTGLDALTAAVQAARSEMLRVPGPQLRVTPDADVDQYREGDTVWVDMGGELGYSGPFRIRARTVTVDGSGKEAVDLEPV